MSNVFTDKLRELAVALATGEKEEIRIPEGVLEDALAGKKAAINPTAYIRMTMSRVADVKAAGSIAIKKKEVDDPDSDDYGLIYYSITINRSKRKKVYTKSEVEAMRLEERKKVARQILELSPNISNYAPEEYATFAKVVGDFQDMIKRTFLEGAE